MRKRFRVEVKKRAGRGWRKLKPKWAPRGFSYKRAKQVESALERQGRDARVRVDEPRRVLRVIGDIDGLHPELLSALDRVAYTLDATVYVRSGLRTRKQQTALWLRYLAGQGPLAARPGTSNHEDRDRDGYGDAADCQIKNQNIGAYPGARDAMRKHGLCLPVIGEDWHVERGNRWRA